MSSNTYSISEIVGTSETSIEDAIQTAITTAAKTLKNLEWFQIIDTRGHIVDGRVKHYQIVMKVGFRYDE